MLKHSFRLIQKNPTSTVNRPEHATPDDYGMGPVTSGDDGGGDGGGGGGGGGDCGGE